MRTFCIYLLGYLLLAPYSQTIASPERCEQATSKLTNEPGSWISNLHIEGPIRLFSTPDPDGHRPFIDAIHNAKKTIRMTMFHLSNPQAIDALIDAAKRGVDVQVILDEKSLKQEKFSKILQQLTAGGVHVQPSSPAFSITHVKAMLIDDNLTFVTSINLTTSFAESRDFGVITTDPAIFAEMLAVFKADWENALKKTSVTPPLSNPNLIWSPLTAKKKLSDLIASASNFINLTVENLGEPTIQAALVDAVKRKVKVRVITPMCDKNANPLFNYPFLKQLEQAQVDVRVMPFPASATKPYMHSKMITVDGERTYIGSINFSNNSVNHARELGIVVTDSRVIDTVSGFFEADWAVSVAIPDPLPTDCPKL